MTQHILAQFYVTDGMREYKSFVEQGVNQTLSEFYDQKFVPAILGSEEFIKKILAPLDDDKINNSIPDVKRVLKAPAIDEIMAKTAAYFDLPLNSLKASIRGHQNWPRALAIFISRRYFGYRTSEISDAFTSISASSIYMLMQRASKLLMSDNNCRHQLELLLKQLIS